MINIRCNKIYLILILIISTGLLSACSTIDKLTASITSKPKVNYENNKSVKNLEVPPDLTKPEFDDSFALPQGVISAVSIQNGEYRPSTRSYANYSASDGPSTIMSIDGRTVLRVNSPYAKSLVDTQRVITKMKFTTLGKSKNGDVITAKYKGKDVLFSESSTVSKFFSHITMGGKRKRLLRFDGALENGADYIISVKLERGASIIRVTRKDGKVVSDRAHTKIVELMNAAFNS